MKNITEVAQSYNVTTRTIRYYEEIGLLTPQRTKGNKRLYSKAEIVKMKLIIRGKKYGFTLDEIKELILLYDKDLTGRKQLEKTIEFTNKKIRQVKEKILELQDMKMEMDEKKDELIGKLNEVKKEIVI